jgi:hypothetical protein
MAQKFQIIQAEITEAKQKVKLSDYLDKDYKYLTGIAMVDLYGWRGELSHSSVDGRELFPRDFDALFIQTNNFVNPSERFFGLEDVEANGKKIEIEYLDAGFAQYPYKAKIYLRLENKPYGK